jgi:hypothetical protein
MVRRPFIKPLSRATGTTPTKLAMALLLNRPSSRLSRRASTVLHASH